ncbi:MAG: aspartyl protease family protein [Chloroflexota bacterium]
MGLTTVKIEISNPVNPNKGETVEFLVDSGAVYSVVPTKILKRLGIKPLAEETYRMADGTKIVRKKGGAIFRYGTRIGFADVIFGQTGDSELLGVTALESMGLSLDPLRRQLNPLPGIRAVKVRRA